MNRFQGNKVGRNDPCPCGSGDKFKRCHGRIADPPILPMTPEMEAKVKEAIARGQAKERQRQEQQGLGKPIISTVTESGVRAVAVGKTLHFSENWKTVHDFLGSYLRTVLGKEWGESELAKPLAERHPVLKWYDRLCAHQQQFVREPGRVSTMPFTGAAAAWFQLAYDLYCLEHNAELQAILIKRIKDGDPGARYEAFVAACFVRAGFDIEFEDERDRRSTHVEFTATSKKSGKKYSVEAKHREPDDDITAPTSRFRIGRRLQRALRKAANHPRVIFIDFNVPDTATDKTIPEFLKRAQADLRRFEGGTSSDGTPLPPAYVFVTNMPYEHNLDGVQIRTSALAEGFKIHEFKSDTAYPSALTAHRSRKAHADMYQLRDSFIKHSSPPSTFDGEAPELAFGDNPPRLVIGNSYLVKDSKGVERPAKLTTAVVFETEKVVMGGYRFEDTEEAVLCKSPMTEAEFNAYKRHPDTFFGVEIRVGSTVTTVMELFDFFLDSYKHTPRDMLLELLAHSSNIEELRQLSREELAEIYADQCAMGQAHLLTVNPAPVASTPARQTSVQSTETPSGEPDPRQPKG